MNARVYRIAILPLACLIVSMNAACQTQLMKPDVALKDRMTHTCKNPNPGNIFKEPDGGLHESFQGWFIKAEVKQGTGWAQTYCYYGLDKAAPANRPVYSVHYQMTGFKSNQCTVSGATVTCIGPGAVIKP